MDQKNPGQPQDSDPRFGRDAPENTRRVMVVVVPLEPSPYVMPDDTYDFSLPLFGGTIPRHGR